MRNSKLYSILEQFDKYEQNRCRKFLQSPYFNRDEAIVAIFDLLVEDINNGKKNCIEKQHIWEQIHLDAPYDDVRFRKYASDLTKLIEDFLCQQMYEHNPLQKANHLIEAVAEKKIEKLYNSSVRLAKRVSEKYPYRSADFYYENYAIENSYYNLVDYDTRRTEKSNFEEISRNLDYFYLGAKIKILCGIISRQSVIASHDYEILIKDEVLSHIQKNLTHYEAIPPIILYYQIYQMYLEPENEEHYFKLKNLLDKYALLFPKEEANVEFYQNAQNYCIRKLNQGNKKFVRELFNLYKDMIAKEILIVDGELSPWYFRNINTIALRLGEYEWTESFIQEYQKFLPENMRENAVSFNLAQVYFYQKKYNEVVQLLQRVEFDDFTYNLNSKAMLLAIYYETDELEPLYSLFDSFRTYLNRHKDIPLPRRQAFGNLIKYTRNLTKILPGDTKAIQKLKKELEANKNVASHGWLLRKIAELE